AQRGRPQALLRPRPLHQGRLAGPGRRHRDLAAGLQRRHQGRGRGGEEEGRRQEEGRGGEEGGRAAEGRAGEARRRRRREGRRRRQGRGGRRQGRLTCTPVCWSLPGTRSWVRLDAGEGRAAMTGAGAFSAAGRWTPVRAAAGAAARAELTPAAVTRIGAVLGVLAALWFSSGDLRGAVAGSVLLGAVL